MPRHLLSVHEPAEPPALGGHESQVALVQALAPTGPFNDRLRRVGHLVLAGALETATTATTVDARGDSHVITDGPYREATEYLGGFWVIEAPDLDVALTLAAEGSRACRGTVEVRPLRTERSVQALLES